MDFDPVNTDTTVSWNQAHLCYNYEETIALSDDAAEFEGELQWSIS